MITFSVLPCPLAEPGPGDAALHIDCQETVKLLPMPLVTRYFGFAVLLPQA